MTSTSLFPHTVKTADGGEFGWSPMLRQTRLPPAWRITHDAGASPRWERSAAKKRSADLRYVHNFAFLIRRKNRVKGVLRGQIDTIGL
ncbi:MAG: hypothetical protein WBX16_25640 [Candidatus Acidiferrales bacterium]